MIAKGFNGFCGASCDVLLPINFQGSYWGVVGKTITRLPEYVRTENELQEPVEPYYPYPHFRAHKTLSVELPNLTDSQDVERECFGAACSIWSEGAWTSSSIDAPRTSGVYFWCHYVPVGETDLVNSMAAFAYVDTVDYEEGRATPTLGTPTAWLVEQEGAWDDADKLRIHTDQRKAFCGPGGIGWIDKSTSGVDLRYYSVGSGTPTVVSIDNAATRGTVNSGLDVVDVSTNKFPLALGCRVRRENFGNGSLKSFSRKFVWGELGGSSIDMPRGYDEDLWSLFLEAGSTTNSSLGAYSFGRASDDAPGFPGSYTDVHIRDWDMYYGTDYQYDPPGEDPRIERFGADTAIVNAREFRSATTLSVSDDPADLFWGAEVLHAGDASGRIDNVYEVAIGSWGPGQELDGSSTLVDTGIRRIFAAYYAFDAKFDGLATTIPAFCYVGLGWTNGFWFRPGAGGGAEATAEDLPDNWGNYSDPANTRSGLSATAGESEGEFDPFQAAIVRVPSDHDGMPSGQEVKPVASPYMRLYGDELTYTWYDDNTLPGEEITTGGSWSAGLTSDGTGSGTKPIRFYDGSKGGPLQMPAPSGFWQNGVGGGSGTADANVKRHLFAIAAAYDTAHPDHDEMLDHTVDYDE